MKIERTVLIQKDQNGFGLRVAGERPVYVESVKFDGPAWKCGVRSGDQVLKVNGRMVTDCDHAAVVQLIRFYANQVTLTLVRFPLTREMTNQLQPLDLPQLLEFEKSRMELYKGILCEEKRSLHTLLNDRSYTNEKAIKILTLMSKIQKLQDQLS